eukprot:m.364154 g.364154  ORF g.364154 m.364154 type:complete len:50 (+) comp25799_c0_seq1:139-288(+)
MSTQYNHDSRSILLNRDQSEVIKETIFFNYASAPECELWKYNTAQLLAQ